MPGVNEHRFEVALNVGDPMMEIVKEPIILQFINRAARDLANSGWLIRHEDAENIALAANEYEYDVPANFAYIKQLRIGDKNVGNASTVDTGTELGAAVSDTTTTAITVDDTTLFVVNDLIQINSEIMLITALTSSTVLAVTRGYFGTTAATHSNNDAILRPLADVTYEHIIPRAYWHMKVQSGGSNAAAAALASRPQFVFNSNYFSFTAGTPLKVVGQRRPTTVYSASDTLDTGMESFIVERATAYAARFIFAQGNAPDLNVVYRESMATSREFLLRHPQEFRVRPSSTRVPGR